MNKISKKIQSLLHNDLREESTIDKNGNVSLYYRHFAGDVTSIEMAESINKEYEELKKDKTSFDYDDHIWSLKRGQKLNYFEENADDIFEFKGEIYYYNILGDVLTDIENPKNECHTIIELIQYGNQFYEMMNEEEKTQFNEIPDELVVYRGVLWNLEEIEEVTDLISYSWTLNYDTALWFAQSSPTKEIVKVDKIDKKYKSVVFKYTIEKDSVLSYFTRRKESEILLNFEEIDIDEVEIIFT
jgi:hypothetical protein